MANQNFNIGLTFSANTQQAKAQIKDLQTSLSQLTTASLDKMGTNKFTQDIAKATSAVADLQGKLQAAVNTDTGRLDLSKFTRSLQTSNMTLKDYQKQFASLGSQGERAFLQVQKAVANAEIPMRRTNGMVDKLWGSLKNVATWQLSSTILNAFTSTLSDAYQYAQDLNKSLNDIRIVTGYGVEEMDKFAVEANKAAKALSTTTTEYTKASLIYFQQGLNSQEVKERTQATIKLANVTGESAETVSEWMTAIWNNFDNGSKSLEYYADVLTKLGAATASSSDEIAGGLEKFAAIADTVGLSYEYAATALATITAQTRQSEDVVGTGLRTIFSRLQSLSLGETLEDGTDLTKYSEALATVGVNIKTASGELRDMDDVLNDLGTRWDQLGRAEQNALAQTVGGVRQYANLIALMDNWDVFKNNLSLAENSTGELAKQNEIYAESWEAANDRIKASIEDLYDSILEDDLFIDLTNGAAKFVDVIGNMVDAMGGLKGLLPGILAIMTKMFGDKILLSMRSMTQEYKTQQKLLHDNAETRLKAARAYDKGIAVSNNATDAERAESGGILRQAQFAKSVAGIKRELTPQEQGQIQSMNTTLAQQDELLVKAGQRLDLTKQEIALQPEKINSAHQQLAASKELNRYEQMQVDAIMKNYQQDQHRLKALQQKQAMGKTLTAQEQQELRGLENQKILLEQILQKHGKKSKELLEELQLQEQLENSLDEQQASYERIEHQVNKILKDYLKIAKGMSKPKAGESLMTLTQGLTSLTFAWSSLTSIVDVWNSKDMASIEKFSSTLMSIGFLLPSLISGFKELKAVNLSEINASVGNWLKDTAANITNFFSLKKNTKDTNNGNFAKSAGPWIAIAAGITLFITTIKLATDHYKRFDTALKASQQNLQLQQDALQGVVEETNNLKTSMTDYSEGIRNLDKLTKGTTEYKEALIESNKAALELIQKHKNLKYEMKDGAIVIDEDSLDQAYQEQLNEQYAAQNRVAIAQMSTNQAQATRDRVEAARDINSGWEDEEHAGSDALVGLGVGGAAAAIAGGIAALVTGPIGIAALIAGVSAAVIGGLTSAGLNEGAGVATEREQAGLKALEEASKTNADLFKDANSVKEYLKTEGFEDVANALGDDVTAIQALVESNAQLERQNDLLAETVAANTAAMMDYDNEEEQAVAQGNLEELWKTGKYEEQTKKAAEILLGNGGFMGIGSDDDWAALIEQTVYKGQNVELKDLGGVGVSLYKDGTLQGEKDAISQDTLTSQAAKIMFSEYMTKDEEYWDELAAQGIKQTTINVLKEAFEGLETSEQLRKRSETDYARYNRTLGTIDSLSDKQSLKNSILTALASGDTEEIDLSILTYEEKEALLKDIQGKTDEVSNALRVAAEKWEEVVANANIQSSEEFDANEYIRSERADTLNKIGIDETEFESYAKTLEETYNMTEKFSKSFAEARLETTAGLIDLNKVLKTNLTTLKTANSTSLKYSKSLGEVKKSLKNWLDLEDVSNEMIEKLVKKGTFTKAIQGDNEAIKTIYQEASIARLKEISNIKARELFNNLQSEVYNLDIPIGTTFSDIENLKAYGEQIALALSQGSIDVETVVKHLEGLGFSLTDDLTKSLHAVYAGLADITSINWEDESFNYVGHSFDPEMLKEQQEELKNIGERYWEINNALESIGNKLNRISSDMEHAFGGAKISLLTQYIEQLGTELEKLNILYGEQKDYLDRDYSKVLALNDGSISFDENGHIVGYDVLKKNEILSEELEEAADQYMSTLHAMEQTRNDIIDKQYEIADKILENIELTFEFKTEAAEFALSTIERQLKNLENQAFSTAEAMALINQQIQPNLDKINAAEEGAVAILQKNGILAENQNLKDFNLDTFSTKLAKGEIAIGPEDLTTLQEYLNTVYDGQEALQELGNVLHEKIVGIFNELSSSINDQLSLLNHYDDTLENYKNIVDLIGKENLDISNEFIQALIEQRQALAITNLTSQKANFETQKKALEDLRTEYMAIEDTLSEEDKEKWAQTLYEAEMAVNEAETSFMESWNTNLELAANAFKESVEIIAEEFSQAVSGIYGSIEEMRVAFDRQQEVSKRFLADYEKTYEISKLNRNITNQIDNTKNVKAQRQLAELASEINAYSIEGRQMSKIDLEYMQKKYDLMVAQIALEEAQNAKNQVRLTRDSSGNWGYVYTANEQATDKAQQTLEDKRYAMEQFMHNTEYKLTNEMIALNEEYQQGIAELAEKYGTDSEKFKQESEKLTQQYQEDLNYIMAEYEEITGRGAAAVQEWGLQVSDTFEETLMGKIYPTYKTFEELQLATNNVVDATLDNLQTEYNAFANELENIMTSAGTSMSGFESTVESAYNYINTNTDGVKEKISLFINKFTDIDTGFPAAQQKILDWQNQWSNSLKSIIDDTQWNTLHNIIQGILNDYSKIQKPPTVDPGNYNPQDVGYTGNKGENSTDYVPETVPSKQNYGRVSAHDTTINGVKYYAYQKVNDGKLDTTSEITYLTEADAKKYASYTEEKHTRGGQAAYRNVQFATGTDTHTAKDLDSLQTNKSISVDHFVAAMDYSKETPTLYYLIPRKNQRVSSENAQLVGRSLVYQSDDAESYDCSNVFWGTILVAKDSATFSDRYGIDITKYEYPETERRSAGTWVSDEKTVRKAEYLVDKVIIGKDKHLYYKLSSGQDNKVKIYGGEWYLASDLDKAFQSKSGSFDTGGYTGDWGPEGKLAVLHQKEIILNAHDTENFLTAIQIVRSLSDKLERNALLANQGLGNVIASSNLSLGGDTLEQHVTITAEFPNVVDHNEIQEAFNTLVNQASQYANR